MSETDNAGEVETTMRLRDAFGIWIGGLLCLILLVVMAFYFNAQIFMNIAMCFYLFMGFYLNKKVLSTMVEWHPFYATLENVTEAKLKYFFFWPLVYPGLFFQLGVNKLL